MQHELLTLAIHSHSKAMILKDILENNGMTVYLEDVNDENSEDSSVDGFYIKVKKSDISRALMVIEANKLFNYDDKEIRKIDDGRKRILVAVDFSGYSLNACRIAFEIANRLNLKVKILHVYHNVYFPSHIPFADSLKETSDESLLDTTRSKMLKLCCEIDEKISDGKWPSVNYSYSLREGLVGEEIESFVLEYKPMLLVLGTKGKDKTETFVLGNVTADVIEMVNVPVLAVPESFPFFAAENKIHIAFLTNLHQQSMVPFDNFIELLKPYRNIKITLLHVNRVDKKGTRYPESELHKMKEEFNKLYPQLNIEYVLLDSPDIVQGIADFADKENVSVICLNTHRRNIFGRIFQPSVSRKVLQRLERAILVLRG
ncbi:MAG: universal stress protein [Dysgonamonadaceae bacterium]|nr:universal stress protein [Dysgonamonadaceae bacterium]